METAKTIDSDLTISDSTLKKESEYEEFFAHHINSLCDILGWGKPVRIKRQFVIPIESGRIMADAMIWHEDGTGTCIEIKTGNNNRNDDLTAIGQLLFYGKIMKSRLGNMPRLVLVRPEIKPEMWSIIKEFNLPLALLKFNEGQCIYLSNAG